MALEQNRMEFYKAAEKGIQDRIEPHGYTASIEPISGTDLFYSDGLVQTCVCKLVFTSKQNSNIQYSFFIPSFCFHKEPPAELRRAFEGWMYSLNISLLLDKE